MYQGHGAGSSQHGEGLLGHRGAEEPEERRDDTDVTDPLRFRYGDAALDDGDSSPRKAIPGLPSGRTIGGEPTAASGLGEWKLG